MYIFKLNEQGLLKREIYATVLYNIWFCAKAWIQ